MAIRSPIVTVLGHVDHGKSSILDSIRGSNVVKGESGAITQAIGASIMPLDAIEKRCGKLLEQLKTNLTIPGIVFIDTPGHAAFTSLRKRGGSIADIAIVVVDINEGFKPQTIEAIEVLRNSKTPFIIAANKVDLVPGFMKKSEEFLVSFNQQTDEIKKEVEKRLYTLVGSLHENFQMSSERFDRVDDYTKQIAIVPCSAKESIGLEELLAVLTGVVQKFLEDNLKLNVEGPGKGIILEVKKDKGLGKTLDVILYDGSLKVGDKIVIGALDEPVVAKIKALLMPEALKDMRDKKSKFKMVKEVNAATGIKIASPDFNDCIIAGMPIVGLKGQNIDEVKTDVQKQIQEVAFDTDKEGILIKADTLGSLEALEKMLREKGIQIRKAGIGNITKKDLSDAESNYEKFPLTSVILGFNIKEEESTEKVKVIVKDVIYALVDEIEEWEKIEKGKIEAKELESMTRPAKIETLKNTTFRQSNPCIIGIEVLEGILKPGVRLMTANGGAVAEIKTLQSERETLKSVDRGRQVAASIPGVTAGRQIHENEIYFTDMSEEEFRRLKKLSKHLSKPEIELLKEIAIIKRKDQLMWGI